MSSPRDHQMPYELEMIAEGDQVWFGQYEQLPYIPALTDIVYTDIGVRFRVLSREVMYHTGNGVHIKLHLERA